jgi:DNA-directed RNA polymerase specialized sigma subunit
VGEIICQLYVRQRTDNQKTQGTLKLNSPKINKSIKKWATELNRTFSKEEIQTTKKISPALAIKEMKSKPH